jgi:putative ABC transport system permease protein
MIRETVQLAIREIRRNALRSGLTILGIVIGVAAVIAMVSIGQGAAAKVAGDISRLGSNLLTLSPGQGRGPGGNRTRAAPFRVEDAEALAREIPGIATLAPSANAGVQVVAGNQNSSTVAMGTVAEYLAVRDWRMGAGRNFSSAELRAGTAVCILGETVRKELFGTGDPVGERIRIGKVSFPVIGRLEPKGESGFGRDQDDMVLMPLRTFQRRFSGRPDVDAIHISARDDADTARVQADIERLMRERRRIGRGVPDDFRVRDMREIAETLTGSTRVLTALLGAVAGVSLLVGGIGIMNIMLVSVTERTREIGTRLAIGALERDVLTQFLVEAVALSALGGLAGIALGVGAAFAGTSALGVPFVFNPGLVALTFFVSASVGVVFGYFPARKAARLDPIDALRHE